MQTIKYKNNDNAKIKKHKIQQIAAINKYIFLLILCKHYKLNF
jgi:hypothetical protein